MKSYVTAIFIALIGSVLAWPLQAADGLLIVQKTTTGGTTRTEQIQIEKDRVRAETAGRSGGSQTVIFDGVKKVISIVNVDRKTYSEMTQADVEGMSAQMSGAMAQMQEQLKNLPPAQRAQVEAMMKGRGMPGGAAAQAPKTEYKKVGTDKVGKWNCDKYEGYQGAEKTVELCAADPATLGITAADLGATKELADFFRKLMPQNADNMFSMGTPEAQGFSGVPVRRVTFKGGQPQTTSELVDVSRQTFPASTFEVPAGFQKEAFGGRGR